MRPRRSTVVVFVFAAAAWLLLSVVARYEVGFDWAADLGLPEMLVHAWQGLLIAVHLSIWFVAIALSQCALAIGFDPDHSRLGGMAVSGIAVAIISAVGATLTTTVCVRIRDWPGRRPRRRRRAKRGSTALRDATAMQVFAWMSIAVFTVQVIVLSLFGLVPETLPSRVDELLFNAWMAWFAPFAVAAEANRIISEALRGPDSLPDGHIDVDEALVLALTANAVLWAALITTAYVILRRLRERRAASREK